MDTRINIITSPIQGPIRIGTSGPTSVTVEEAEITRCYLYLDAKKGCERDWEKIVEASHYNDGKLEIIGKIQQKFTVNPHQGT